MNGDWIGVVIALGAVLFICAAGAIGEKLMSDKRYMKMAAALGMEDKMKDTKKEFVAKLERMQLAREDKRRESRHTYDIYDAYQAFRSGKIAHEAHRLRRR